MVNMKNRQDGEAPPAVLAQRMQVAVFVPDDFGRWPSELEHVKSVRELVAELVRRHWIVAEVGGVRVPAVSEEG